MGRGSSKAGGGGGGKMTQQQLSNVPTNAQPLTDQEAADLRDEQDSMYDPSTAAAVKMYISDTNFDNQGHSLSQTMNYLLDNGVDFRDTTYQAVNFAYGLNLNANDWASMQYTNDYMAAAVHPIGKDIKLQRGAHDDLLRNVFGINNYSGMTESQLQSALIGRAWTSDSYYSASYDISKNPFLGNGPASGGREVVYNINAGSNTKMLFGAKKQAEIVLDKNTNYKITGVRFTGKTATPRNRGAMPQIEIDVETF